VEEDVTSACKRAGSAYEAADAALSLCNALTQVDAQRLHRRIGRFEAPLQLLIDHPHQRTKLGAGRIDFFRIVHALRHDELFKARICALNGLQAIEVIASLQRKRFNADCLRRPGK